MSAEYLGLRPEFENSEQLEMSFGEVSVILNEKSFGLFALVDAVNLGNG